MLTDSSKIGRRGFGRICSIEDIDILITDNQLPAQIKSTLEAVGVDVITV